jgi:hypothetical protein
VSFKIWRSVEWCRNEKPLDFLKNRLIFLKTAQFSQKPFGFDVSSKSSLFNAGQGKRSLLILFR